LPGIPQPTSSRTGKNPVSIQVSALDKITTKTPEQLLLIHRSELTCNVIKSKGDWNEKWKLLLIVFLPPCLSACLIEPDGFNCPDASSLRLADSRWLCDTQYSAQALPVTSTVRYVDASVGDDSNLGSKSRPWRTIVKAASTVQADTTVLIRAGTYDDGLIDIANSGTPGKPIVFKPDGFSSVVIKRSGFNSVGNSHIFIAFLRFENIRGASGNAIRFEGPDDVTAAPATNITIRGNMIVDTWSSGIAIWGVKWKQNPGNYDNVRNVIIESNILELNTSGDGNEIITVANGVSNVDVRYNTLRSGGAHITLSTTQQSSCLCKQRYLRSSPRNWRWLVYRRNRNCSQ